MNRTFPWLVIDEITLSDGIVNLTGVWQTGQHETPNTQLATPSFSPLKLSVLPVALPLILAQLS